MIFEEPIYASQSSSHTPNPNSNSDSIPFIPNTTLRYVTLQTVRYSSSYNPCSIILIFKNIQVKLWNCQRFIFGALRTAFYNPNHAACVLVVTTLRFCLWLKIPSGMGTCPTPWNLKKKDDVICCSHTKYPIIFARTSGASQWLAPNTSCTATYLIGCFYERVTTGYTAEYKPSIIAHF